MATLRNLAIRVLSRAGPWPIMCPVFRFPHPTGHHGIGTVTYHWVDADRPEAFTADPDDRRELMVQLWYPARLTQRHRVLPTCGTPTRSRRR
jgi:predicted dienelactone hydrolase